VVPIPAARTQRAGITTLNTVLFVSLTVLLTTPENSTSKNRKRTASSTAITDGRAATRPRVDMALNTRPAGSDDEEDDDEV
jgi:hypothetical protein